MVSVQASRHHGQHPSGELVGAYVCRLLDDRCACRDSSLLPTIVWHLRSKLYSAPVGLTVQHTVLTGANKLPTLVDYLYGTFADDPEPERDRMRFSQSTSSRTHASTMTSSREMFDHNPQSLEDPLQQDGVEVPMGFDFAGAVRGRHQREHIAGCYYVSIVYHIFRMFPG